MDRREYLLTVLAEEATEIAHRVHKAMRFGLKEVQPGQDKTNEWRMLEEICQLNAVLLMLAEEGMIVPMSEAEQHRLMELKINKVNGFMVYSRELGCLKD